MQDNENLRKEGNNDLKKEIEEYHKLKTKSSAWSENMNKPAYIISKQWLKKWKKYIGAPKRKTYLYREYDEDNNERKHPGPITNKEILDEEKDFYKSSDVNDIYNVILKPEMGERFELKIINENQWEFLCSKYQGVPIKREKYRDYYATFVRVEMYFHPLNLIVLPDRDDFDVKKISKEKTLYCSKRWNLGKVRERIVNVLNDKRYGFKLELEKFRLWKLNPLEDLISTLNKASEALKQPKELQENTKDTEFNSGVDFPGIPLDVYGKNSILDKLELGHNDRIIIEIPNEKGEYVFKHRKNLVLGKCDFCYNKRPIIVSCKCDAAHYCSFSCKDNNIRFHADKCTAIDINEKLADYKKTERSNMGLTGLQNLGNTCFMNSGLQCLSNTWQLARYFLNDLYFPEINPGNRLGMQGRMAHSFAKLIKRLWYESESYVSPWDLKKILGKQHTTFCGYSQQDSQELISAVLDSLHEDLNRVKVKPYVEQKTTDDPNNNLAKNPSWYNFLARNRSIIVDLFYGQYKSMLQCPVCHKYSITFDPFSVVSLPVPRETKARLIVNYLPYSLKKKIIRTIITIERESTVDDLRSQLVETFGIKKYGTIISIIENRTIERLLGRNESIRIARSKLETRSAYLIVQEINPRYWESPDNTGIKAKIEEDEEAKKYKKNNQEESLESKEDYNNGLSDDLIKFLLNIYTLDKQWQNVRKSYKTFGRMLYTKKSYTLKELYMEIFRYLRPLFEEEYCKLESADEESKEGPSKKELQYRKMSDEELFSKAFPNLTEKNWEEKLINSKEMPYILRFVNVNDNAYLNKKNCFYCDRKECGNCPVPFTSKVTVGDMVNKLRKQKIDSFYLEKGYYERKCFMLELIFNEDNKKAIISKSDFEQKEIAKNKLDLTKSGITIYDCLDNFVEWETLDKDNLWYCPTCKDNVPARKKFEFTRAPPILVFHLKRFKTNARGRFMGSDRLNDLIDFPLTNLDFTRYLKGVDGTILYDLYAVSNHYGSTGFGHYTAYAWNEERKGWYEFDDSRVNKEDPRNICSTAAYVLFYRRKEIGQEIDYAKIRQDIPEGYVVPVVELTKGKNDNKSVQSVDSTSTLDSKIGNGRLGNESKNK